MQAWSTGRLPGAYTWLQSGTAQRSLLRPYSPLLGDQPLFTLPLHSLRCPHVLEDCSFCGTIVSYPDYVAMETKRSYALKKCMYLPFAGLPP